MVTIIIRYHHEGPDENKTKIAILSFCTRSHYDFSNKLVDFSTYVHQLVLLSIDIIEKVEHVVV